MSKRLEGKRVLITQAEDYMGPATAELFAEEGAEVMTDNRDLTEPGACEALIRESGHVDVLIANLASNNYSGTPVTELQDRHWERTFDIMVHPLHRLTRAVLPQMQERQQGRSSSTEAPWR